MSKEKFIKGYFIKWLEEGHSISVMWDPLWDGPIERYQKNPWYIVTEV